MTQIAIRSEPVPFELHVASELWRSEPPHFELNTGHSNATHQSANPVFYIPLRLPR
jgi:hypothetical protein